METLECFGDAGFDVNGFVDDKVAINSDVDNAFAYSAEDEAIDWWDIEVAKYA